MQGTPPDESTHADASALEAPGPRSRARLRWSDAKGSHVADVETVRTLGSGAGADVVVSDRAVSRVHAELLPKADGVWLRDLRSRNGSYVAGVKILEARIPDGATLRVGATELTLVYESPSPPADLWPHASFGSLLGRSAAMRELFAQLDRIARSEAPVVVSGQTGTGKEMVARAVHEASKRGPGPYVIVDCAALPEALLEAELFGHVRGAFTGAVSARIGAFEAAAGGTIFLDEIGELPLPLQPKLLRVLESRTIRRIGESEHRPVDVRIVSATHRDLRTMVNQGTFREDLYFRVAVLPLHVPALSERRADIPLLLARFLGDEASLATPELLGVLNGLPWPGNVRELRNFAERLVAIGPRRALELAQATSATSALATASGADHAGDGPAQGQRAVDAPAEAAPVMSDDVFPALPPSLERWFASSFREFRASWGELGEREYLRRLMGRTARASGAASREAGLERTYLYRLLKKYDV